MTSETRSEYKVFHLSEIDPVHCLCGWSHRMISQPDRTSFHVVDITTKARKHYHRAITEYYFIAAGEGEMELNDDRVPVSPGDLIEIPPETRHRAVGKLRVLVIALPGFDREDEHFD